MRTLILLPIIHTSADLGSLAKDVTKGSIASFGEDIWKKHNAAVETFWGIISDYFDSIDVSGMKIYQDGMIADGEIAQRIVEEGVRSGSRNYELVASLLKRGAVLLKTEDFNLVKEERDRLVALTQAKSIIRTLIALIRYKLVKNRLLVKRDEFIAGKIGETLCHDEKGILFIGAYHNIKSKLPCDIKIIEIKDTQKVKEYQQLLPYCNKNRSRFEELRGYLVEPISNLK
jgi:hypothetical protein